ncbi:MAG: outer membrane lipoprotein carrier protein LolA [Vicinamibacteria bacterium]|nr:outer membrane lipoprotein carrier protein LolA [Vicinamibacteria bacterium]
MRRLPAALLLAMLAPAAAAADAASVLRALETAGRSLKTMQAGFVETRLVVLLDEKTVQKGTVYLQVPGRFRWNYLVPQESAVMIRDGEFFRYFPRSKQVFKGKAKGEADLLVGFGPGAAGLGDKYKVTLVGEETVAGLRCHVLDLQPRPEQNSVFSAIRLYVDQARGIPVQTRLTEPTGDHTTILFEKVTVNGALPKDAFDLKLPKDVVEVR